MTPVYEQMRTFQTEAVYYVSRDEVLLEQRQEVLRSIVDGVVDVIRSAHVETTGKLYLTKVVDLYVDNAYNDDKEM